MNLENLGKKRRKNLIVHFSNENQQLQLLYMSNNISPHVKKNIHVKLISKMCRLNNIVLIEWFNLITNSFLLKCSDCPYDFCLSIYQKKDNIKSS